MNEVRPLALQRLGQAPHAAQMRQPLGRLAQSCGPMLGTESGEFAIKMRAQWRRTRLIGRNGGAEKINAMSGLLQPLRQFQIIGQSEERRIDEGYTHAVTAAPCRSGSLH